MLLLDVVSLDITKEGFFSDSFFDVGLIDGNFISGGQLLLGFLFNKLPGFEFDGTKILWLVSIEGGHRSD